MPTHAEEAEESRQSERANELIREFTTKLRDECPMIERWGDGQWGHVLDRVAEGLGLQ